MQFIKQRTLLPIRNIESKIGLSKTKRKHGDLLPNSIRCIICGPSNCGKTNVILSLLENINGLRFENVYLYSRSLDQPKYKYLNKILSSIHGVGFFTFSSNDAIIEPHLAKPNSVFIFDDVVCDKQNNMRLYFTLGRHHGHDSFYLSQTYSKIPKQLIRDNANLVVLFRQDDRNLRHIFNDFSVGCDMNFDEFRHMCICCWSEKFGFVVIDMESDLNSGRYRKGFDNFIHL